jgi:CelD/BcsL family acetyltransferase involved in cellulose biosynthesis
VLSVDVMSPAELGAGDHAEWRDIRAGLGTPANPFMDPAFTRAIGEVRPGARVAVLRKGGSVLGYFPHERGAMGQGRAIGLGVSDAQGAVLRPDSGLDTLGLLRSCSLSSWEFDNLEAGQPLFQSHAVEELDSPVIDVSRGYDHYLAHLVENSPKFLKTTLAKERRLGRQVGDVRFVFDETDPRALRTLMEWKSAQYRRTGRHDRFAQPWISTLVHRLADTRTPEFAGVLSVLYAGDRPLAAHFGLRSHELLSCWFPAYDPEFGKYSPGLVLHLRMAEAAAASGIGMLDLGRGAGEYKDSLKTGHLRVYEGAAVRPGVGGAVYRLRREPPRAAHRFVRNRPRLARFASRTLLRLGRLRKG